MCEQLQGMSGLKVLCETVFPLFMVVNRSVLCAASRSLVVGGWVERNNVVEVVGDQAAKPSFGVV